MAYFKDGFSTVIIVLWRFGAKGLEMRSLARRHVLLLPEEINSPYAGFP